MSKIYVNQNSLRLTLQTGVDISEASNLLIKYIKPDKATTGNFSATISGTTDLYYDFAGTELDTPGEWTFYAFVIFSDARTAPGEPVYITVYNEGN